MSDSQNFDAFGSDSSGSGSFNFGGLLGAAGTLASTAGNFIAGQSNAAGDQAAAKGYQEESQAYSQAAGYAAGNVKLAEESTAIQEYQQQRALLKSEGSTRAAIAANNLGPGGSGMYLLRDSMAQGALAKGLIGVQGSIQSQGYAAQSAADIGLSNQAAGAASAATAAASAASTSSDIGVLGGLLGVASKALSFIPQD